MTEKLQGSPRKVLIVEDAGNWQRLLPELFQDRGVEAVVVKSADAAKKALEEGGFTEVVTDGLEGRWTDVAESAGDLPVKLLSGDTSHKSLAESKGIQFLDKRELNIRDLVE